ncbi:MAG: hypothetical protein AAGH92_10385, partial [Planctomycetota bacterium]
MTRCVSIPITAVSLAMFTLPVAAQDGPSTRSFFQMFLWSDDPMGLAFIWILVLLSVVSVTLSIRFAMQFRRSTIMPDETRAEECEGGAWRGEDEKRCFFISEEPRSFVQCQESVCGPMGGTL